MMQLEFVKNLNCSKKKKTGQEVSVTNLVYIKWKTNCKCIKYVLV